MINRDSAGDAVRETSRAQRLGASSACVNCGEYDPVVLIVEKHHVAGRANDPNLTVHLCRNCHARVTDKLRAAGVSMSAPANPLDRLIALLGGLADLLLMVGAALKGWARWLSLMVDRFNSEMPGWREVIADLPCARDLSPVVR